MYCAYFAFSGHWQLSTLYLVSVSMCPHFRRATNWSLELVWPIGRPHNPPQLQPVWSSPMTRYPLVLMRPALRIYCRFSSPRQDWQRYCTISCDDHDPQILNPPSAPPPRSWSEGPLQGIVSTKTKRPTSHRLLSWAQILAMLDPNNGMRTRAREFRGRHRHSSSSTQMPCWIIISSSIAENLCEYTKWSKLGAASLSVVIRWICHLSRCEENGVVIIASCTPPCARCDCKYGYRYGYYGDEWIRILDEGHAHTLINNCRFDEMKMKIMTSSAELFETSIIIVIN